MLLLECKTGIFLYSCPPLYPFHLVAEAEEERGNSLPNRTLVLTRIDYVAFQVVVPPDLDRFPSNSSDGLSGRRFRRPMPLQSLAASTHAYFSEE